MPNESFSEEWGTPWVYPDLQFGFGLSEFQPGDDPVTLVKDVLSSLSVMERHTLPEICPDGFPDQPPYFYNSYGLKLKRIDKFLKQRVASPSSKESPRREEIVDLDKAAAIAMDSLAETNHPVSQALVALHKDFAGRIPKQQLDFVNIEVLKQTHWNELKALLNIQVAGWRIGQSLSSRLYGSSNW